MSEFISFIGQCFRIIYDTLHINIDVFNGFPIYLSDLLLVILVFGFVISIYWKGAKA